MAKTAQNYQVQFGYGATDDKWYGGPNPIIGPFHRGNDRYTPCGTPLVVAGQPIGKTGTTGASSGCHLHTQAGTDIDCQKTFDPTPLEFKAGKVVATGKGAQWGNYITIKVGTRYITYAHLSRISTKVGNTIGGDMYKTKYAGRIRDWSAKRWAQAAIKQYAEKEAALSKLKAYEKYRTAANKRETKLKRVTAELQIVLNILRGKV